MHYIDQKWTVNTFTLLQKKKFYTVSCKTMYVSTKIVGSTTFPCGQNNFFYKTMELFAFVYIMVSELWWEPLTFYINRVIEHWLLQCYSVKIFASLMIVLHTLSNFHKMLNLVYLDRWYNAVRERPSLWFTDCEELLWMYGSVVLKTWVICLCTQCDSLLIVPDLSNLVL